MHKIAILILAHKNPEQVLLFVNQFDPACFDIYVHFDKKFYLSENIYNQFQGHENVFLIPYEKRISVNWGDCTRIKAEKVLLDYSYLKSIYSFYILCSGQDLLIKKSTELYNFLMMNPKNSFNESIDDKLVSEFRKRNELRYPAFRTTKSLFSRITRNAYKIVTGGYKHTFAFFETNFSKQFDFHFGSSWFAFNNESIKYIRRFENDHPDFLKGFLYSLNPDECYFQTILHTSEKQVSYLVNQNLTYIDWSENQSSPKILTEKDFDKLVCSDCFFARKFDEKVDKGIIQRVIEYLGEK